MNVNARKRTNSFLIAIRPLVIIYFGGLFACLYMPKILNKHTAFLRSHAWTPLLFVDFAFWTGVGMVYFQKMSTPVSGFVGYDTIIPTTEPSPVPPLPHRIPRNFKYNTN